MKVSAHEPKSPRMRLFRGVFGGILVYVVVLLGEIVYRQLDVIGYKSDLVIDSKVVERHFMSVCEELSLRLGSSAIWEGRSRPGFLVEVKWQETVVDNPINNFGLLSYPGIIADFRSIEVVPRWSAVYCLALFPAMGFLIARIPSRRTP